ncbi:hypothetical protein [Rhizobium sp. BK602]|uniref:hypothetical protein n=1 Tax=Rhizobium sp. BK602 TaxID=2586986 RepID=UPI00160F0E15|nr:hypothetical protein [Rhizobium sp. BK602]
MTPDGHFHVVKFQAIPHQRIVVATQGDMKALGIVVTALAVSAVDYDSARAYLADHFADLGLSEVDVYVAGWSGRGPAAFHVSDVKTDGQVRDIEHVSITPPVSDEALRRLQWDGPTNGMLALMKEQAMSGTVGGFMNVAQVHHDHIAVYTAGIIDDVVEARPRVTAEL